MHREPPKSRLKMDIEFDKLNDLPSDVTEKILSVLPIKEAVRTSILSSRWRHKWAVLRELVFDELSFPGTVYDHEKLVKIIDHVLLLHIGPVDKVRLSHRNLNGTADIDRWILHLSRNSLKEFSFEFWEKPEYKMPSSLFSCHELVRLDLRNCLLKLSPTFNGFKNLKKLKIRSVTLTGDDFENLIVYCPLLDDLTVECCRGLTKIKIDAPNIRKLYITGSFEDISLQNTLKLVGLCVYLIDNGDQRRQVFGSPSKLVELFSQCAGVKVVAIMTDYLKYLAIGDLPLKLPEPCLHHLRILCMDINFNEKKETLAALCLLRSAPALHRLLIMVRQKEHAIVGEVNSWLDDNQNFQLGKLRIVEAFDVTSTKAGLDFIKILLLNSPKLEKVFVKPASEDCYLEISKTLNQFRRSSEQAQIIFKDELSPMLCS